MGAAPAGGTVLVREASHPRLTVEAVTRPEPVTFRGFEAEEPVLDGLSLSDSSGLAFEGFRITEVTEMNDVSRLTLRGNDISPHDVRITSGADLLFEDNDVHDLTMEIGSSGRCVPPRCGYGFRINTGTRLTFRGNRFHRIPADAIQTETRDAVVVNNVFEQFSAQAGMFAVEDFNLIGSGLRTGAHDLADPPRFADPTARDYSLVGGSPGIDAGTSDHGAPARDQTSQERVDTPTIPNTGGGAAPYYDMGALEFDGVYVAPSGSYADRVLATPGLLAYWRLGESGGTTALDAAGDLHGTYKGGVALGAQGALTGDGDTAVTLDGRDDSVLLPALPSATDFTVEGWQRMDGTTHNTTLYGKFGSMRLLPRPTGFYAGVWAGGREYVIQAATPSNVDEWVHWALVRSGASMRLYRDGIEIAARNDLPATTAGSLSGDIARMGNSYAASARIDEVAVYDQALTAEELFTHRDLGR